MRRIIIGSLALGLCLAVPVTVMAQSRQRVPHDESSAFGLDLGVFAPSGSQIDTLDSAPMISGLYEYYITPRVSLRGSLGWTQPSLSGSTIDEVRTVPVVFDANYNWEGGKWHPFVGAGMGAYWMQYRRRGAPLGDSDTKLGVNLGGGIEYFFNRAVTFKGEGRYHAVQQFDRIDPSGVTFTAGIKTYF